MGSAPSEAKMVFQGNDPDNFKNTFGRGSTSGPVFSADHSRTQSNGRSLDHGRIVHNSIFQSNSNDFARDTTVKHRQNSIFQSNSNDFGRDTTVRHNKNNFVAPKSLDFGFHPIAGPSFGLTQKPKTGNFDSGNLRSGSISWNIGGSIVTAKLEPSENLYRQDIKKPLLSEKGTGPSTKAAKKLIDTQGGKVLVTRSAKKLSDPLIASSSNRRESLLRSIRSRIIAGSLTKDNFVSADKENSQFILTPNDNGQLNKFTSNHNHNHHDQNVHNSQLTSNDFFMNQFTSNKNHNKQNEHRSQLNTFTSNQNHQNNQNGHNSQVFDSNNNRKQGPTVQRQIPISIISDVIPAPHQNRFQPSHNFISNFNQNNFVRNENQGNHHRNNQFVHSENTNNVLRLNHNNKFEAQQNNQLTNQISQNNNQIETHHNDQNNVKVDHNNDRFVSLQNTNHVIQNNNRFVSQQRNQHNHGLNQNSNNNFVAQQHVQHQSNRNNNDITRQNIVQHKKQTNQIKNKRIHESNLSQKTPVPTRINVVNRTPQPSPVTINQMVKSKNKLQKKPLSTTSSAAIITARPQQKATVNNAAKFRTVTSSFKTSKKPISNLRISKVNEKNKLVLSRKQIPKTAAPKKTQTSKTSSVSSSNQRTRRPQIINASKPGQSKKSTGTINLSNSKTSARTINIHNSKTGARTINIHNKSKRPGVQVTDVSGKPVAGGLPFSALQALQGSGGAGALAGLGGAGGLGGLGGALAGLTGSGQQIVVKSEFHL